MDFEREYSKSIEKLYADKRNDQVDIGLINLNNLGLPHKYQINYRVDMTNIDTYTIDPDGCEDADDGFSIYYKDDKLFLAIHIADPTEYININSDLWRDILNRVITRYPSNRKPIHMMPDEIMEKSSLMENKHGNIKKALTILSEINKDTYLPTNNIKLLFTKIKVNQKYALPYNTNIDSDILDTGINISLALQNMRGKKTIGIKLKLVDTSTIKYDNTGPYLHKNTIKEKHLKQMIEEFAIFANSFIGEYLNIHLDGIGIYRTCDISLINDNIQNLDGNQLLQYIITNGIRADYMHNVASHDLVGSKEYTHFTSPIRRVSDCVCHYLLKYLYLKNINNTIENPFTKEQLKEISLNSVTKNRSVKKIQYSDNKFRLIQVMNDIIKLKKYLQIEYYITGYINGFINIIINKIDNFNIYLSYSLKRNNYKKNIDKSIIFKLDIKNVNCRGKFDEGSIPELDNLF